MPRFAASSGWVPALLFAFTAALLLAPALFTGRALLPAWPLSHMAPWDAVAPAGAATSSAGPAPQWNVLQWDGMAEFYPWRAYTVESLMGGRIPLWNDRVLCGTPFLANSQSAPLYPLHWLLMLPCGPLAVRMVWLAWLHLMLAGLFSHRLGRSLGLNSAPAAAVGVAFQFSGFAVTWLELPSFITVGCWMPLFLALLREGVAEPAPRRWAAASAAGGMMLLGGHLQIALYGVLAGAVFWGMESFVALKGKDRAQRVLPTLLAGAVPLGLALMIAAPQLLPSMELSRMSHRVGTATTEGYAGYLAMALPSWHWVTLLLPDYYGLPLRGDYLGFWRYGAPNTMEYAGHVTTAALPLVLVGLVVGLRSSGARLAIAIGMLGLLLAAGTPLCALFYFHLPGFAQSGSPARALVLVCLAQSLLVGFGAARVGEAVGRDPGRAVRDLGGALLAAAGLLTAAVLLAKARIPVAGADAAGPAAIRQGGGLLAVMGCALLGVLWFGRRLPPPIWQSRLAAVLTLVLVLGGWAQSRDMNPTAAAADIYPSTPETDRLSTEPARVATVNRRWSLVETPPAILPPNASMVYGWREVQGYDSLMLGSTHRFFDLMFPELPGGASPPENGNVVFVKHPRHRLLALTAVGVVASRDPVVAVETQPLGGAQSSELFRYQGLPEAFTCDWVVADDAAAFDLLNAADSHRELMRRMTLSPGSSPPTPAGRVGAGTAVLSRRAPGMIDARTSVRTGPAMLFISEGFAPGWRATVEAAGESRRERVHRADIAFQGVLVPQGEAVVRLRYEPASFRLGCFLMLVGLLVLAAVAVAGQTGKSYPEVGLRSWTNSTTG